MAGEERGLCDGGHAVLATARAATTDAASAAACEAAGRPLRRRKPCAAFFHWLGRKEAHGWRAAGSGR